MFVKFRLNNTDIINPANIPIPPREGIGAWWIFLSSGISNNFFCSATFMIAGIAKNVTPKAMIKDIATSSINSVFRKPLTVRFMLKA